MLLLDLYYETALLLVSVIKIIGLTNSVLYVFLSPNTCKRERIIISQINNLCKHLSRFSGFWHMSYKGCHFLNPEYACSSKKICFISLTLCFDSENKSLVWNADFLSSLSER